MMILRIIAILLCLVNLLLAAYVHDGHSFLGWFLATYYCILFALEEKK